MSRIYAVPYTGTLTTAGGNTDIGAARTVRADISAEFARYGISPPLSDPPTRREAEVTIHRGADPRLAQRPF